jgi:hypothetical protein
MNLVTRQRGSLIESSSKCPPITLRIAISVFVGIAIFAIAAPHAAAQGCAMCYQNAASSGAQGRAALRHGILILLLPALGLFAGIFVLIVRRRDAA